MSLRHRCAVYALALLFVCRDSWATSAVLIVIPGHIFIGTDSVNEWAPIPGSGPMSIPHIDKTAVIRGKFVISTLGLIAFPVYTRGSDHKLIFNYNFADWISNIQKHLPAKLSVSMLTNIVERESGIAFKDFDNVIAGGAISRDYPSPNFFVEYYIAGYERGVATINRVHFRLDWNKYHLDGPTVTPIDPDHQRRLDNDLLIDGINGFKFAEQLNDTKSEAYKELIAKIPKEWPRFLSDQDLSVVEATTICLAMLRYQTKHNEGQVVPPYIIIDVPRSLRAIRKTYPR
jgi:hypothetical protein